MMDIQSSNVIYCTLHHFHPALIIPPLPSLIPSIHQPWTWRLMRVLYWCSGQLHSTDSHPICTHIQHTLKLLLYFHTEKPSTHPSVTGQTPKCAASGAMDRRDWDHRTCKLKRTYICKWYPSCWSVFAVLTICVTPTGPGRLYMKVLRHSF